MALHYRSTVLFVADIGRATSLYRDVLEQEVVVDGGTRVVFSSGIVLRQNANAHSLPEQEEASGGSAPCMEIYFETDDIDDVADRIFEAELRPLHPVAENPWGQRILRFFDPDAHLIEVGERVECIVRREAALGIPADLIALKTRLPVPRVLAILAGDPVPACRAAEASYGTCHNHSPE
ncbi:MAG: VOC family protein [Methanomicrobiaceae archaeon]|nr:VOC family protein [Methanomicrobiaceae archaeon]